MRGSFSSTATYNGQSAARAVISVRNHFGENYRSYGFGVAYKPCMTRGRNHYGSLRIGASAGSDTNKFLGGLHLGYEHNYVLRAGWTLYWQVKSDVMIKGADVLRAGVVLGVKLPMK